MKPIHTVLMVLVLAALGGYVYVFERQPVEQSQQPSEKPKANILVLDQSKLRQLEVSQNTPAQSVELKLKDAKWTLAGKAVDPGRIETLLTQLETWQAADTLEETFELSKAPDFGLEPPDLILRLNDGELGVLKIGNKTPTNSGYYVLKEGDPRLYLAYVNVPEELHKLITQPPLVSPSPAAQVSK